MGKIMKMTLKNPVQIIIGSDENILIIDSED